MHLTKFAGDTNILFPGELAIVICRFASLDLNSTSNYNMDYSSRCYLTVQKSIATDAHAIYTSK